MAEFKVITKGNADPHGKPRVYFCCHPEDFGRVFYNDKLLCFEKICEDVFKTHDCAIYYTEDMNEPLDDNNINIDLKRMNLFLVPVTFRLMNEPCRAMAVDIAYAKANNIKILPFMMESGLDAVYALQRNFGERQYLNPYSNDATEVGYEEKLKKILEVILISDEMAKKVRAAFDAYIFLSYRKKDRNYANELMRIIHNIPGCRDIAIWYDEFLTPGESWRENIKQAMEMVKEKSNLFTLLVTPNLLEEYLDENGELKKNFVMENEYPEARDMGMRILPTEMVETDHDELNLKYDGIPEPVKSEDEHFTDTLLSVIEKIAISENDNDPQHNFLIGLAYLEGIDVEVNCDRGIELITTAAEAGEIAAMRMLYDIYDEGKYVSINYAEALKWAERIYDFAVREYGEEHPDTLTPLNNIAYTYGELGDHKKALELYEKVYKLSCKIFGEEHPDTLTSLNNLSMTYGDLGDYKKAFELQEKVCKLSRKILGEEHPVTLLSLNNLAGTYGELGDYKKALELFEKVYKLRCKILGEEHPGTLASLNNIAGTYGGLGDYKKALELQEKEYKLSCKILGEEHPDTLLSLNNLAYTYGELGDHKKSLELYEKVYKLSCKILGEEHPDTLSSFNHLAYIYGKLGDYKKSLELFEKVYKLRYKILGEEHPDTLLSLNNLAYTYGELGDHKKALELQEKVYKLRCKNLGEEHPYTIDSLKNCAYTYFYLGDIEKSLELFEKLYALQCKTQGEQHRSTLTTLSNIQFLRKKLDEK